MLDLIARLEAATGPDRELDGLIFKAVAEKPGDVWTRDIVDGDVWMRQDPEDRLAYDTPRPYTSSIDAALTLVPEGRAIRREYLPAASWPHRVWIYRDSFMPLDDGSRRPVLGKTEAITLCIAALKARAAADEKTGGVV